jgi:hypothetical protein
MKRITRTQAICQLRAALRPMMDSRTSLCAAVAERGVFCGGFGQWSLAELRRRFPWIAERHPGADRATFVALADRWQRTRTGVEHGRLPCDVAERHRGAAPCAGWEELYEAELARFVDELCGERVQVVPDELALAH